MPQRVSALLERLIMRVLALWVRPHVLPDRPGSLLDTNVPLLYMLENGGLVDRSTLAIACRQNDLPMPSTELQFGSAVESNSVDRLPRRSGPFTPDRAHAPSPRLQRLVEAGIDAEAGELQVVPVAIYWGRSPGREASMLGLFYSENWQIAGRIRKFFTSLLHGRNALVQFSEPLSFQTLKASGGSALTLERKLARVLRVHFHQRRIASLGPDQSHRRVLIDRVIADPSVRRAIATTAEADGRSLARQRRLARRYAFEIAADVSYPTIRVLHRLLNWLWNELYDGIQLDGIDRLRQAADGREIVYVPCHRSHIDYLLMSYILYEKGFSLPHVAAGLNLNLPFIGNLLRSGGAFFLRRSFAGKPLYARVFSTYLKLILQRGNSLEYFIEGGRSRTGYLLPPKGGMLAMTVHAYLKQPTTPVVFVPIYFGYERLLEGRAFIKELDGGQKQKESVFALVRSLKLLRGNYGRVHVNFGRPIGLDSLLVRHRPHWRKDQIGDERPDWLVPLVDQLGQTIMRRINEAASVTPISLLATALLASRQGVVARPALERQIRLYHELLGGSHAGTTVVVPPIDPSDTIEHGLRLGFIEVDDDDIGPLIRVSPGQSAPLTYFRNNIQHLLTVPALVAASFTNGPWRSDEALKAVVRLGLPFLEAELFLELDGSDEALTRTLKALQGRELLHPIDGGWRRASAGSAEAIALMRLAEGVMPTLERDYLAASLIARAPEGRITSDELGRRCARTAARLAATHGRDARELHDRHVLSIFQKTLESQGYIARDGTTLIAEESLYELETEARSLLDERTRHAILAAVLACTEASNAGTDQGSNSRT